MVAPFLAFAGLTVAAFIKQIVADYTADVAKKKLANSFLIERMDSKLEKRFGKDFLKKKLTPQRLEEIRELIHEELGAFSPKKDLDELIVTSLNKLGDEHQAILAKLDNVESLLEKVAIPLAYTLAKESEQEIPEELLTGLLEGTLQGRTSSERVLQQLIEEKKISPEVTNTIKEFDFIKKLNNTNDSEIAHIVKKFTYSPEEINSLSTLMDISALLAGPSEDIKNVISEFVFKMISEGVDTPLIENSVISFSFLIQRLGKLDLLSESDRLLLASFLKKNVQAIEDPTRMLESYFLLSSMGLADDIDSTFIKEVVERYHRQGTNTTKEMKGQLRVSSRLARFLRKIGFKSIDTKRSLRTIRTLIKRLDKRKFIRSTQLLKYQLERLTSEINLLIAFFEKETTEQATIDEVVELMQMLLEILNRPRVFELDLDTRKKVIELMDSSYFLYDLLAMRNSWLLLSEFQMNVKSLYSPTLGSYKRINFDKKAFNRALGDYSRLRLKRIEKDLPLPPTRKKKEIIKE
ncbi:MAG: hypothetical protein ACTSW1_14500 [Candidatus Hodarchaeales archaeon]